MHAELLMVGYKPHILPLRHWLEPQSAIYNQNWGSEREGGRSRLVDQDRP